MKNKIISILLILIMLLPHTVIASDYVYEMKDTRHTVGGVEITTIKRLTKSGWITINVAKADLNDSTLSLKLLKDKDGLTNLKNVKYLADSNNAVCAINGDFFSKNTAGTQGSSIGVEISDGELLSGYALSSTEMAVSAMTDDGFYFDYIDTLMTVTAPNGEGATIKTINKIDNLDGIVMYDSHWGEMSIGSQGNLEEMVVEDDTVVSINHDEGPVKIPENGYILAYLKDITTFIPDNFSVGDKVAIDTVAVPDITDDINMAIGGGTILITDGQEANITHNVGTREPRTAWGVDKKERYVYFVTVDGRSKNSVGVTLSELTDILLEFGIHNAINLDGGGSTTMVTKNIGNSSVSVANSPSDSYSRPVANGLGIVSSAKPGKTKRIEISSERSRVFAYTSIPLSVIATDEKYNKTDIDTKDIKWTVSDKNGTVKNNVYYPQNPGKVTLTATYNGITDTIELTVLSLPHSLTLSKKEATLNKGDTITVTVTGKDEQGYTAPIPNDMLGINVSENIVSFDKDTITVQKDGKCVVTYTFGDVSSSLIIKAGKQTDSDDEDDEFVPSDKVIKDKKNVSENVKSTKTDFSFALFGNTFYNKSLLERTVTKNLIHKVKDTCDMIYFAGINNNIETELIPMYKSDEYSYRSYKNCSFFTLNNSSGSIHSKDKTQWERFIKDIKATKDKNIFLIMPAKLTFTSDLEKKMFEEIINDNVIDKGKDIYVFSNGIMQSYRENGMHCFTVDGVGNLNKDCVLEDAKYLKVNVKNGEVTYSFEEIFE